MRQLTAEGRYDPRQRHEAFGVPLADEILGPQRPVVGLVAAAALLLLLVACANVASRSSRAGRAGSASWRCGWRWAPRGRGSCASSSWRASRWACSRPPADFPSPARSRRTGTLCPSLGCARWASTASSLKPVDPATYGAVALGLLAVALLAGLVPALWATRTDPAVALRQE